MAPIGSVIKNGLLYIILIIPIIYLGIVLIAYGLADLIYASFDSNGNPAIRGAGHSAYWSTSITELTLGLALILGLGGLVFMKSLSDVVEDGMVEF